MSFLRVIGDTHGCIDNRNRFNDLPSYIELCQQLNSADYSVQLGDFGFEYTYLNLLDSERNKICLGNHENLDVAFNYPHVLGRFGNVQLGPFNFFFVSGGFSLDKKYRIKHEGITGIKSWWKNEELSQREGKDCLIEYEKIKPDVVLTHECPSCIARLMGNTDFLVSFGWPRDMVSSTQHLLQQLVEIHRPKLFLYGHWHREFYSTYKGTEYYCLPERRYLDFDEKWNIIGGSCYDK